MDYIRDLVLQGINIETIAYGMCASAATFLLMGGSKRSMGKNAYILIHQMSDTIGGTFGELQSSMKNNKKHMKHFRRLYLENTDLPDEYLEKLLTKLSACNEAVEWSAILKPHRVKTMARMAQYERVLCIQDTTELDFTGHPSIQGLGRLNHALGTGWFVIRRWR